MNDFISIFTNSEPLIIRKNNVLAAQRKERTISIILNNMVFNGSNCISISFNSIEKAREAMGDIYNQLK